MADKIEIIQVWRLTAAALVVLSHAYSRTARTFPPQADNTLLFAYKQFRTWGHLGVDFFFVISGFIMVWTNWDQFGVSRAPRLFLARRIRRIVPTYWVVTTLGVVLIAILPTFFSYGQELAFGWILSSYLFVPTVSPGGQLFSPVVGLGWTLNYEMYFYATFALALLLPRMFGILALSLFFGASVAIGAFMRFSSPVLIQSTSWLLLEFLLGVWVGVLLKKGRTVPKGWATPLLAASLVALALALAADPTRGGVQNRGLGGFHLTRFLWWGVPSAVLLYASVGLRQSWLSSGLGQSLVRLGNGSYSIYLFQAFALPATAMAMRTTGLNRLLHVDLIILLMTVCSIAIGWGAYLTIERPLTRAATPKRAKSLSAPEPSCPSLSYSSVAACFERASGSSETD